MHYLQGTNYTRITGVFIDGDQENEKASLKCWRKRHELFF